MNDRSKDSARRVCALLCCILGALFSSPVLAQSPPQGAFTESVNVDLVNLEVWVRDAEGKQVSGLASDDFTLIHDGATTPISHFSELQNRVPVEAATPDTASPEAPIEPQFVVVFDQLRLTPASQKRMAQELRTFLLAEPVPAANVLLLQADVGLSIAQPFGSTIEEIVAALESMEGREASAVDLAADVKQVSRSLQGIWDELTSQIANTSLRNRVNQITGPSAGQGASATAGGGMGAAPGAGAGGTSTGLACEDFVNRVESILVSWAQKEMASAKASLARLSDAASFLSGLDGPKTLLYLSDGLGLAPGAAATAFVRTLCPAQQTDLEVDSLPDEMSRAFRHLARRMNANQITLHAIQGSGLEAALGSVTGDASSDTRGARSFARSQSADSRQGLSLLAEETGGRFVGGSSGLDRGLREIGEEMGTYYSLAYTPPAGEPGDHSIEIAVGREDLEARYRRSYSDKTPGQWMMERMESALYLGLVSNPLAVSLAAGQITAADDQVQLPLHIRIPVEKLTYLDVGGRPMAKVSVKVMALHAASRMLVMTERDAFLPRPGEGAGEMLDLRLDLRLDGGVQMFAIGVRDQTSGEASFVSTTFQIDSPNTSS